MTNLLGRKLGKYEVVERIASGGMAEVYKAFQPGVERFVAIKVMHGHLAQADDFVQRFQREARGVGRLLHPNILRLIDFDVDGEMYYMVMEYIPGGTLRSYLNNQKQLPIEEALRITTQLADALSYAHQQGMIHRDIKPGNVMFADETHQHVVLTDFGIARLLDDAEARLTLPGAVFGTPSYMSPEALRGEVVDARSDLYSLGVMLYEMVTGQRPYVAETPYSLLMKLAKEPLTPPRKLNPALPNALQKLLLKVLEKEPVKRFSSAADFGAALKQLQDDLLVRSSRSAFPFQRQATTKRRPATPTVASKTPTPAPAVRPSPEVVAEQPPARRIPWLRLVQVGLVAVIIVSLARFAFLNRAYFPWPALITEVTPPPTNANSTTIAAVPPSQTILPTATAPPVTPTIVPPTVTLTPSPTLSPSPTPSPQQPSVAATTAGVAAVATTIAVLPPPLGVLRLSGIKDTNVFVLDLGPVKLPPTGSRYELWLRHDNASPLNLGILPVEQGEISITGSKPENLLANYNEALITLERDTDPATMANTIVFASQWPAAFATPLRQLLVDNGVNHQGFLPGAVTESQLAFAQSAALQAALAKADLTAAQKEAEGIFNLLEGAQSAVAGDKNKDGRTDNLGDGFGIRPYLAASQEQLRLLSQMTATAELAIHSHTAVALVTALQPVAELAAIHASQLVTVATVADAQPLADELQRQLAQLFKGVDQNGNGLIEPIPDEGGLQVVEQLARTLMQYPLWDKSLALGGVADSTATVTTDTPVAVGTLRFREAVVVTQTTLIDQPLDLRFTLALAALAPPPAGSHYELWLATAENATPLPLARVAVTEGYARLAGSVAQNPFANVQGVLLTLNADDATAEAVGVVVYHSALPEEVRGLLQQLLGPAESAEQGLLLGLRAQAWQAYAQVALMQEALHNANLEQVRSDAEYVVHALTGKAGYGDLDGDGQLPLLENPVSVREYLTRARKQTAQLGSLAPRSPRMRFYTTRALATYDHSLDLVERATEKALQIFAGDTIADVQPFVNELAQLLTLVLAGDDRDGNGLVDPLADEGAVLALFTLVAQLGEYPLYRLESSAQVK